MNGRDNFTEKEAVEIRKCLKNAREAGFLGQKYYRDHLKNELHFYITDFTISRKGFAPEDFDALVMEGRIKISK